RALARRCKILDSTKTIIRRDNNNKLIVLSNDGGGADSYSVYASALDEIHEYSSDDIYGKLKTGTGQWDEPLTFTITTASSGEDEANLEMQLYNMAKSIEEGKGEDENFYYRIYEAEKGCAIDSYEEWFKANPALGDFRKPKDIVDFANRCKLMPLQENMFRRMFLNQHVATDHIKNAINMELWNECVQDIDFSELVELPSYGGLDLSSKNDITGFIKVFYRERDCKYIIVPYLFTPKDTVMEREEADNNPYSTWVRDGDLITTEGRYIKFKDVLEFMTEKDNENKMEQLGFDRWGTPTVMNVLEEEFDVVPLGQGTTTMTQAINQFENLLIDKDLIIAKNAVFNFMAKNCVATYNEQLEVKYSKKKSKFKIDGIIAMLMALLLAVEVHGMTHYNPLNTLESMDWDK
ncbi:MAG: terminase TerL endonuclease subunit, partial [Clostridium sp.]